MKQANIQPNFEALKTAFYRAFVDCEKANMYVAMQNLCGKFLPSFNTRKAEFKKDFNQWLDRLDIRQAGELINVLAKDGYTIPGWMKRKEYIIDYNQHEALDLIRIDNIND